MYRYPLRLLLLLMCLPWLGACSEPSTPEQQVRDSIQHAISAIESREATAFSDLIDDNYRDSRGQDKKMLIRLTLAYLLRNRNINIFTRINSIHFDTPEQASVMLYAGMAATPVEDIQGFLNLRADLFEFELKLVRDGDDWLLNNARWQRLRAGEPENEALRQ